MSSPKDDEGLWVRSDPMPDGTYATTITVEGDRAFTLNRERAIAYSVACIARATEAEHDAAVYRLLTEQLEIPHEEALRFIARDLLPDRPDEHGPTKPLKFLPAIGRAKSHRPDAGAVAPIVYMQWGEEDIATVAPEALRGHGLNVLETLAAVDLDSHLLRCLKKGGLDDDRARAFVGSLAAFLPTASI